MPAGIVELTAFSGALYGACFFPALVLGLHWKPGNGTAVIASFLTGIIVLLAWDLVPGSEIVHEIFPAMGLSTGVYVGLAMATEDAATEAVVALIEGGGRTSETTS